MKYKFLIVLLFVFSCFANAFAQERDFEIEVSMDNTHISKSDKRFLVKVKITNKAAEDLRTSGLGYIEFGFSKCLVRKDCTGNLQTFNSNVRMPEKNLRENESAEFVFDLMNMHWIDKYDSYLDVKAPKNFKNTVSEKYIYFQAVVDLPRGFKVDKVSKRKIPVIKSFLSNTTIVVIN